MKRAVLPLAIVTLCAAPAAAQTPRQTPPQTPPASTDAAGDPARVAFETGLAALQDERYADALASFEQSYRVRRVASVALNLGITLRALGRLVEARERFEEFLTLASPALHERYDHDVAGYLGEIARRVGRVHLTAIQPENASVTVDDHRAMLDSGNDVVVDPGEHRIEADAPGFAHFRQAIRVETGGRAELNVTLVPNNAPSEVNHEPVGAGTNPVNGAGTGAQPTGSAPQGSGTTTTGSASGHVDARVALTPAESGSAPIYTRPVFWGATLGAVVVVAGIITAIAVVASSSPQPLGTVNGDWTVPAHAH